MKRYYYRYHSTWLHCIGRSKKSVQEKLRGITNEVLTECEARHKAEKDLELENAIQCAAMCSLMCD